MKKLIKNIQVKSLLFGADLMFAFLIPMLSTIAVVPAGEVNKLSPADSLVWIGISASVFTLAFGNSNNKPQEEELFFPFQNTIFFLFPLGILTILEHIEASPTVLVIPYLIASPLTFILNKFLKQVYIKYTIKAKVIQEIYSEILEIIKIWKSNPKASLSSENGKWIEYHFKRVMALIDVEAEVKLFKLSKQLDIGKEENLIYRRSLAKIIEESEDYDVIKLSGKTIRDTGYFLRKDIIEYLLDLYGADRKGTEAFTRMRKNCPFYEIDEQPKSTARDWFNSTKYFIEPLWQKRQAEKKITGV